jgi:hypothetical protein
MDSLEPGQIFRDQQVAGSIPTGGSSSKIPRFGGTGVFGIVPKFCAHRGLPSIVQGRRSEAGSRHEQL